MALTNTLALRAIPRALRASLLTALVGTSMLACSEQPRTEVVVVVDTDMAVPDQIDRIALLVTGPDGREERADAVLGDGQAPLPRTLGLLHRGGAFGPFRAVATAYLGDEARLTRHAEFDFQEKQTVVLIMHLLDACQGRDCGAQTCTERGCSSVRISAESMLPWTGAPPRLRPDEEDAGVGEDGGGECVPMSEVCNGRDDDCNGMVDEGFTGTPEACNGTDDDCDGFIDEGFPEETCNGEDDDCDGVTDESITATEVCNGVDDDCNGMIDDGVDTVPEVCNRSDDDCDLMVDEDVTVSAESCNGVDDDCDLTIDEGFDIRTDVNNCGECGRVCVFMNGAGECREGVCTVTSCNAGFADCDPQGLAGQNGCETNTNVSTSHCGVCGNRCSPPNRNCCSGTCMKNCD